MRLNTSAVPAEMAEQCRGVGIELAGLEFGSMLDFGAADPAPKRIDWTRGTFEGDSLPIDRGHDLYDACEQIMDDAASEEWERLWEEVAA